MKLRMLVLALMAALGSACTSTDKPRATLDIKPVLSIRHGTQDAQSYYQLGRYYHGQKRLAQAEEAYLQATAADEKHVDAFNALGTLYAERGELERAAQMFRKVTAMAPGAAYLFNNLGYAYFLLGRPDEAYAAVRQALSLDNKLERAWANLKRIASLRPESSLAAAAVSRRLDLLPIDLASKSTPDERLTAPSPAVPEPVPALELTLDTELAIEVPDHDAVFANVAAPEPAVASVSVSSDGGGRLHSVSSTGPVEANAAPVRTASAESAGSARTTDAKPDISAARVEVSNGNGVARFARKFSSRLRADKVTVTRITNFGSFSLKKTVVEYQPGHEVTARTLIDRSGFAARLLPAVRTRPGSDVRIVLGRDALSAE